VVGGFPARRQLARSEGVRWSGTRQEGHLDLVARKVSASLQVEGLDVRAALEAAGAGGEEDGAAAVTQSLGEAMYRALVG